MHGDEGFYWVKTQKKRFYERTMPEERKQRVKDEGGAVASALMNERQPRPKGGWNMAYVPMTRSQTNLAAAAYLKLKRSEQPGTNDAANSGGWSNWP
jgi:hypothetical protein